MLQLLISTEPRALRQAVLQRVRDNQERNCPGQILIVPEQFSHEAERMLCEIGGDTISRYAEVLSFTRLAHRVFAAYGGVNRPRMDKAGRLIAMARAVETVGSRLKLYGACGRKPEFLLRLLTLLDELKSARIGVEQLGESARQTGGQLAVKLEELALLQESLETVCASIGEDANDQLMLLDQQLQEHPYIAGREVFLWGFSDLTAIEMEILHTILEQADSVTVALLTDGTTAGPFSVATGTLLRLRQMAPEECRTVRLDGTDCRPAALCHLTDNLFGGAASPWESAVPALHLHSSGGVFEACMDVAGRVQDLARQGWRYRDMAICCTDMTAYRPVLEDVFDRFRIPLYVSGTDAMESNPVVGMVQSALDAAAGGMETEDVLQFLKSGLSTLTPEQCDQVETYARTWRIRGRKWDAEWDMHPEGYGAKMTEETEQQLNLLNEIRLRGAGPLLSLRDGLRQASNTAQQVTALYDFLTAIGLADTLEQMQQRCRSKAELRQAQLYGQMYELVVEALEQLYQVLGDTVRTPEDFAQMVSTVLAQYDVGTIPANMDSVACGAPPAMRYQRCRALFLLGADDGAFPSYQPETSLLTEQERKQLVDLGLPIMPGRSMQLDRELAVLYQALAAPAERLYLSYTAEQSSYLFLRISRLFPQNPVEQDEMVPRILLYDAEALGQAAASGRNEKLNGLIESAGTAVQEAAAAVREKAAYGPGSLEPQAVSRLYGKRLQLSASKIDQYAACRCAYFLRYGLQLKPQKEASFDAPIYGTFVHAILEQTAAQVRQEGGFRVVSEERLLEIAREKVAAYEDETLQRMLERSERLAYLFARNQQEVLDVVRDLGRELRVSQFEPVGFEIEFSALGPLGPITIEGHQMGADLSGFVDRVDLYTKNGVSYLRIVDYKTGKKSFDYTDLLNGRGLQMLIYLFALSDNGQSLYGENLQPAGVLYFPARRPILPATQRPDPEELERKRQTEQTRQGLLLNDSTVLEAMEQFVTKPVYLPIQLTKDGTIQGDLADREELQLLRRHVQRTLEQMADSIADGAVEPNPIVRGSEDTACAYCDYAAVCHRASGIVTARPMRKTDRKDFWKQLRMEAEDHG